jgi:tRNA A-37 threonylcarbamoyl transferase component Bud32
MFDTRYRTLEPIGEGASAWVYKAVDTATDSIVAVKVLKPGLQTDPVTLERFRREVQIARRIGHPGVVAIYDLVQSDEQIFMVMEYLSGPNLKQYLALHQPLRPPAVVALLTRLLELLRACHAQNVIHRDLKPQNVIVAEDGSLKVLDFGIAKMTALGDLTQTGSAPVGSPEYMAPELFAGGLADPRTDLYAVGIMAFELLAGHPPFRGASVAVLAQQHLEAPVPSLTARRDIPEWLQQVVERLLAKRPFERYQTADEVLADIAQRRVIARELPALPRRECPRCGAATLAELAVCLSCGWDAAAVLEPGECDLLRTPAADPDRLAAWGRALFGVDARLGRRSLLLSGITPEAASVLSRGAAAHDLPLLVSERSGFQDLRKALPLALLCMVTSGVVQSVGQRWSYYGRYFFSQLDTQQMLGWSLALVLVWVCARRFRQEEVRPVWSARAHGTAVPDDLLADLRDTLTPERDEGTRALVTGLVEQFLLLQRRASQFEPALRANVRDTVLAAARLAALLSEVRGALADAPLAQRVQRCLGVLREAEGVPDEQRGAAEETLRAYYELEERAAGLQNRLIVVQALFARSVGRLLVHSQPLDDATRDALAERSAQLATDLDVARQVQRELEALV